MLKLGLIALFAIQFVSCFHHSDDHRRLFDKYFQHGYDLTDFDFYACPSLRGKKAKIFDFSDKESGLNTAVKHENASTVSFSPGKILKSMYDYRTKVLGSKIVVKDEDLKHLVKGGLIISAVHGYSVYQSYKPFNTLAFYHWSNEYFTDTFDVEDYSSYLSDNFKNDVNQLPTTYTANEAKYIGFIEKYGTHFLMKATFGSSIRRFKAINENDAQIMKYRYERNMVDYFNLSSSFDEKCKSNETHPKIAYFGDSNEKSSMEVLGGDAMAYKTLGLVNWNKTVQEWPSLVSVVIKPIYTLITNQQTSTNFREAVRLFMSKSYMEGQMIHLRQLLDTNQSRKETTEITAKYKEMETSKIFNSTNFVELGKKIENEADYYVQLVKQNVAQ